MEKDITARKPPPSSRDANSQGKEAHAGSTDKDRGMVWEGNGLSSQQAGWKQKPQQQSKTPEQDTEQPQAPLDLWDSSPHQLAGVPTKHSPDLSLPPSQLTQRCLSPRWSLSRLAGDINPPKGTQLLCIKICLRDQSLQSFPVMFHFYRTSSTGLLGSKPFCPLLQVSCLQFPWVVCSGLWMCTRNVVPSLTEQMKSRELKIPQRPCGQAGFPSITSILWRWEGGISSQVRVGTSRLPLHWDLCCLISMSGFWKK